jgi:hypothetical protein
MSNYAFLKPHLTAFISDKMAEAEPEGTPEVLNQALLIDPRSQKTPFRSLYESLGLEEVQFTKAYLDPWKDLSLAQMQEVLTYLNFFIGRPKSLVFTVSKQKHFKALNWLIVHLALLNLPGLDVFNLPIVREDFGEKEDLLPYKQCLACGRLDQDTRGHAFEEDGLRYCHVIGCNTAEPNAYAHLKGCCYKTWRNRRESIKKSLREAGNNQKEIQSRFLKSCEKQFNSLMDIQYDVRPKPVGMLTSQ